MVRDEEKYQLATHYRKRGFSYSEIAKLCGVSKGTVSNWFAKKAFSKKVKKDNIEKAARENVKRIGLVNKARQSEREKRYQEVERAAKTEFRHYKTNPKFMAALMLYLAQGDTTNPRLIRLSDSRPEVHVIFNKFAKSFLGVSYDQIRFWLLLYPTHKEAVCVRLWSQKLKLTREQFYKNQVVSGESKRETLQSGVGNTIIGSTVLKRKLNIWLELATKELQK
jgi:predicted transcriptional regulator